MSPSKALLKQALLAQLEGQLATAREAHVAATEGAISDEARAENDKDTRGLEQSYLARGYARRVVELEAAVASIAAMAVGPVTRVSPGALVMIEEDDEARAIYVATGGGGLVLDGDVTVVTPTSPMGRALLGKHVDDESELIAGGARRTFVITAVT